MTGLLKKLINVIFLIFFILINKNITFNIAFSSRKSDNETW